MNERQREVLQQQLDREKEILRKLEYGYREALEDIEAQIEKLLARSDAGLQHVIYQVEYQRALKSQVEAILDQLHNSEFETVSEYLESAYEDGFIGTLYDLQGQGIPFIFPIDQSQVAAAIQHDTKLSKGLYTALGKDIGALKRTIAEEISRGISTARTYTQIGANIAAYAGISKNNAMRIARTEAGRIQNAATSDVQRKARDKGADVVKQWCATLDGRTRKSHKQLDGQLREVDEAFEVDGRRAMYPGGFGIASEDINCRCCLLSRARWNLGSSYTQWAEEAKVRVSDDGTTQFVTIEAKNYKSFVEQYNKALENAHNNSKIVFREATTIAEAKQFAKDMLGFSIADFDKFDVEIANVVNREITKLYNVFGNIHEAGYLEGIRLASQKVEWVASYASKLGEIWMRNVSAKESLFYMSRQAQEQFQIGFWSTGDAEHSIRHEAGHAIQHWLTDNDEAKRGKIAELRQQVSKACGISDWSLRDTKEHMAAAGEAISYYAMRDDGELIAESVAEYLKGTPREVARKVVEILLEGSG